MKKAQLGHILLWCFFLGMGSTWINADRVASIVSLRMAYTASVSDHGTSLKLSLPESSQQFDVGLAEKAEEDKFQRDFSTASAPVLAVIINDLLSWESPRRGGYPINGTAIGAPNQARHILLEVFLI